VRETPQALFNDDELVVVDQLLIERLKQGARQAPTRRFRLCLHQSTADLVQEMIIVHCRDNYSRPHQHPDTATSLLVVEGAIAFFLFDADGRVTETIHLGPPGGRSPCALRLAAKRWHMPVCTSDVVVFYETMTGPFQRETINVWAPWSPEEHDAAGIAAYRQQLGI